MYAIPIRFPNVSPSLIQKLLIIQNSDLHIAIDSGNRTFIDQFHEEIKNYPVQDHLYLIISQYLTRALQPNNPAHSYKKKNFLSRFLYCVPPYLSSGIQLSSDYETTIRSLHTKAISDFEISSNS